ncbi:hypothetical protein GMMP1_580026 [Candidatus Magnetomoraceae bacterium gMMP-1]
MLDVGGKKENKRGQFRPPLHTVEKWEYLNIDKATTPDYLCSADRIPVQNETFDFVLMTEVIEHLEKPADILSEINRVLKKSGAVIMTMPFLFPIHSDPSDYQRWTPEKIKLECEKANFTNTVRHVFCIKYSDKN